MIRCRTSASKIFVEVKMALPTVVRKVAEVILVTLESTIGGGGNGTVIMT